MKTPNVKFSVSLSNGETLYEGKDELAIIEGELSPWQRLKAKLNDVIKITSISLYTDDNRRFNLPSLGKNPKFKVFCGADQPISYNFFRSIGVDVMGGDVSQQDIFSVIEATYPDGKKLQIWVSEVNPSVSWSLIIN